MNSPADNKHVFTTMLYVFRRHINITVLHNNKTDIMCREGKHTALQEVLPGGDYDVQSDSGFPLPCWISKHMAGINPVLSAYYGNLIVNVAKKNVLKIHPDIKRQICKKCRSMLVDKTSATMKIKNKNKSKHIEWMCNTCGTKREFPAEKGKDHRVWLEKPEAVAEVTN